MAKKKNDCAPRLLRHRPLRRNKPFVTPRQRLHIRVTHPLRHFRRQDTAITAAAIKNNFAILVWEDPFNVPLQNATPKMLRFGGVPGLPFAVLAHVHQSGLAIFAQPPARLFNRDDSMWFHKRNLMRAHEFYERHGGKALVIARFMPIVRTFAPVVAGMARMSYPRFVVYTIVGAVVWAMGMTWLGFFLGSLIPDAGKYLEYIVALIIVVSIAPPAIHLLRERNKATLTPS